VYGRAPHTFIPTHTSCACPVFPEEPQTLVTLRSWVVLRLEKNSISIQKSMFMSMTLFIVYSWSVKRWFLEAERPAHREKKKKAPCGGVTLLLLLMPLSISCRYCWLS